MIKHQYVYRYIDIVAGKNDIYDEYHFGDHPCNWKDESSIRDFRNIYNWGSRRRLSNRWWRCRKEVRILISSVLEMSILRKLVLISWWFLFNRRRKGMCLMIMIMMTRRRECLWRLVFLVWRRKWLCMLFLGRRIFVYGRWLCKLIKALVVRILSCICIHLPRFRFLYAQLMIFVLFNSSCFYLVMNKLRNVR